MNESGFTVGVIDDGYGDIKYTDRNTVSFLPSFVTDFKQKPKDSLSNNPQQKLKYIASEVGDRRYVVGDYAMKLDPNIRWVGGENKHRDSRFPIILKTTLGLMTKKERDTIDTLMMNLPIKYDTPERRYQLEQLVRGTHRVGISEDGVHFINKTISVESIDIKKQPFGSMCDIVLDDSGELIEPKIAKGFNVVVDIGARTLNILTLEALEEQPELTIQTSDGMFTAYNQIGTFLEQDLDVIIPDGKLPQIISNREIKNRDITPLIEQAYQNHANNILTILDKVLINSYGFVTNIIFTGGGSEVLRPYLESSIKNNTIFLDRYATARGLRKYGLRQAAKNHKSTNISVRIGQNEYGYR